MAKSIPIPSKPQGASDGIVQAGEEPHARELEKAKPSKLEKGDMVRITLDLPRPLHRKLKMHVAYEGITIADYLRVMLDERL